MVCDSFETPWTVVHQVSLSRRFSREEYWSDLLFPSPGDLPNPGIKPISALQTNSLLLSHLGSPTRGEVETKELLGKFLRCLCYPCIGFSITFLADSALQVTLTGFLLTTHFPCQASLHWEALLSSCLLPLFSNSPHHYTDSYGFDSSFSWAKLYTPWSSNHVICLLFYPSRWLLVYNRYRMSLS